MRLETQEAVDLVRARDQDRRGDRIDQRRGQVDVRWSFGGEPDDGRFGVEDPAGRRLELFEDVRVRIGPEVTDRVEGQRHPHLVAPRLYEC